MLIHFPKEAVVSSQSKNSPEPWEISMNQTNLSFSFSIGKTRSPSARYPIGMKDLLIKKA